MITIANAGNGVKKLFIYLQYLLPKAVLSRAIGRLANSTSPRISALLIRAFIRRYQIDLLSAQISDPSGYRSFNDFFTRQLKMELRPIDCDSHTIICPVDGTLAQFGQVNQNQLLQAKNFYFDLHSLLGGYHTQLFNDGNFATFYLAPKHYHRVHMPIAGTLVQTIFVPGRLFSVNQISSEYIPHLYSRNERLICLFKTDMGHMAIIFVGAMIVGSIQLSWQSQPIRKLEIDSQPQNKKFEKAEELGYFKLGSTVILLFEKNRLSWSLSKSTQEVFMGHAIGKKLPYP